MQKNIKMKAVDAAERQNAPIGGTTESIMRAHARKPRREAQPSHHRRSWTHEGPRKRSRAPEGATREPCPEGLTREPLRIQKFW